MEIHKTQLSVNEFQIPHTQQGKCNCRSSYLKLLKTYCVWINTPRWSKFLIFLVLPFCVCFNLLPQFSYVKSLSYVTGVFKIQLLSLHPVCSFLTNFQEHLKLQWICGISVGFFLLPSYKVSKQITYAMSKFWISCFSFIGRK